MIFFLFCIFIRHLNPKNLHSFTATCEATTHEMVFVGQPNVPQRKE